MDASGPRAASTLRTALEQFKATPGALTLVREELATAPRGSVKKWRAVWLLSQLASPDSVPTLLGIARARLNRTAARKPKPKRASHRRHHMSPSALSGQMMVQGQAVLGIETIAKTGDAAAIKALESLVNAPEKEVRYAAVFALHRLKKLSPKVRAAMVKAGMRPSVRVLPASVFSKLDPPSSAIAKGAAKRTQARQQVSTGRHTAPPR
jgi:HEAT repeat protein